MNERSESTSPATRLQTGGFRRGAQTLHRAMLILRHVAEGGTDGRRVVEIAKEVGLHAATTNRLLVALASEGLVEQVKENRRYRLGPEIHGLNLKATRSLSIERQLRPAMRRLAEETQDTIFLMIRSGFTGVCIGRDQGSYPVRAMTLDLGDRRPLGVGSGSLALLAFSQDFEVDELVHANAEAYRQFNADTGEILALVERTRRDGYALNDERTVRHVSSVALPIYSGSRRVVAAITVSSLTERMALPRRAEILARMEREIALVSPLPD